MTIKRTDLTESDEQRNEREEADNEANDAAERAREERLAAADKARQDAEIKAARAEGELEASKRQIPTQTNTAWTDEQWESEGAKRGMTGQQMRATAEIAAGISGHNAAQTKAEIEEARKEAREAKAEAAKLRANKGIESVASDFYDKNPALKAHRNTVNEFLDTYPDKDTVDGATLQKRLSLAADFVKGRVKEKIVARNPGQSGSSRLEGGDEREHSGDEIGEFDPKGTGNQGAAYLMAGIHGSFGQDLRDPESLNVWKASLDEEGRGVSVSSSEDVENARLMRSRQVAGGSKGK